jgi:hypothetical protein
MLKGIKATNLLCHVEGLHDDVTKATGSMVEVRENITTINWSNLRKQRIKALGAHVLRKI